MATDFLVSTDWLAEHLGDPNIRVVDIRGFVTTKPVAPGVEHATYRGAATNIWRRTFPGRSTSTGRPTSPTPMIRFPLRSRRRHGLPRRWPFAGIGDGTTVVAVDHAGGQFATRLWWALRYYGHDDVAVLDGGWNRWVDEGREVESGEVTHDACRIQPRIRPRLRGLRRGACAV